MTESEFDRAIDKYFDIAKNKNIPDELMIKLFDVLINNYCDHVEPEKSEIKKDITEEQKQNDSFEKAKPFDDSDIPF